MNKKRFFALGILFMLVVSLTACTFEFTQSPSGAVTSWSTSGRITHNREADSWLITVNRVNGHARRDIDFTAESLSALHVESTNSDGSVSLLITQGEVTRTIDLTGEFNQVLDISNDFQPGSVRLRLEFENAETVRVSLSW